MNRNKYLMIFTLGMLAFSGNTIAVQDEGEPAEMGFFVTSICIGDGGNFDCLVGADAYCQALADATGTSHRIWHAYLSTQGSNAVDARDRIGAGP